MSTSKTQDDEDRLFKRALELARSMEKFEASVAKGASDDGVRQGRRPKTCVVREVAGYACLVLRFP